MVTNIQRRLYFHPETGCNRKTASMPFLLSLEFLNPLLHWSTLKLPSSQKLSLHFPVPIRPCSPDRTWLLKFKLFRFETWLDIVNFSVWCCIWLYLFRKPILYKPGKNFTDEHICLFCSKITQKRVLGIEKR